MILQVSGGRTPEQHTLQSNSYKLQRKSAPVCAGLVVLTDEGSPSMRGLGCLELLYETVRAFVERNCGCAWFPCPLGAGLVHRAITRGAALKARCKHQYRFSRFRFPQQPHPPAVRVPALDQCYRPTLCCSAPNTAVSARSCTALICGGC
jgi:hypothetical protein